MEPYYCSCCGWSKKAHDIFEHTRWVQLDLFANPFKHRKGWRQTLANCAGYKASRRELYESTQSVTHFVPCIFFFKNGTARIVDVGS